MKNVSVFVIGFPKCGTTAFCSGLSKSKDVYFSVPKEPRYFSGCSEACFSVEDYHDRFFKDADPEKVWIEGSTTYATNWFGENEIAARRLIHYNPDAIIICMLRNPYEQIVSSWRNVADMVLGGVGLGKQMNKIRGFSGDLNKDIQSQAGYIESARYIKCLEPYCKYFGEDQVWPIFFDDYRSDSGFVVRECLARLGCDSKHIPDEIIENKTSSKGAYSRFSWMVRSCPGYASLLRCISPKISKKLRKLVSPLWTKRGHYNQILNKVTLDCIEASLQEDTNRLLRKHGREDLKWQKPSTRL